MVYITYIHSYTKLPWLHYVIVGVLSLTATYIHSKKFLYISTSQLAFGSKYVFGSKHSLSKQKAASRGKKSLAMYKTIVVPTRQTAKPLKGHGNGKKMK